MNPLRAESRGRARLTWLAVVSFLGAFVPSLAPGAGSLALDPTPALTLRSREQGLVQDVRALPGGGVLVAGMFHYVDNVRRQELVRLLPDGSFDPASPVVATDSVIMQALPDGSGRTVVAGMFSSINGVRRDRLAQLLPDGSVDESFVPDPLEVQPPLKLHPAPDGGFFVVGYRLDPITYSSGAFARKYDSDGRYDSNRPFIQLTTYPLSWAVSAAGDLAVCTPDPGYFGYNVVYRWDSSGQAVPVNVLPDFNPFGVAFDATGALVLTGQSMATGRMLMRVMPDGIPDPAFGGFPPVAGLSGDKVTCLTGGEIFVKCVQSGSGLEAVVARFSPTGAPLGTLLVEGMGGAHAINLELTSLADGDCAFTGVFVAVNGVVAPTIAKVAPDGQVREFRVDLEAQGSVSAIASFAGGLKLIGGNFTEIESTVVGNLAAISPEGSVYGDLPLIPFGVMQAFGTAEGGAVVIGGFPPLSGTGTTGLAKVLPSGAVDSGFLAGISTFGFQSGVGLPDGSVLLAGYLGLYDSSLGVFNVMRVGADGRIDHTYQPPQLSGYGFVNVTAVDSDPTGRIAIAGSFVTAQGQWRPGIAIFAGDGQLDPTFAPAIGLKTDALMPLQLTAAANGDVYVIGMRGDDVEGRRQLIRFKADGSIDEAFAAAVRDLDVSAYAVEPEGTLLAAIQTQPGNVPQLVRLSSSGAIDPTVLATCGPRSYVRCMSLEPSGRLWIGGTFTEVDGQSREGVASFSPVAALSVSIDGPDTRELPLLGCVVLHANVAGADDDVQYQWYHDGQPIRWARCDRLPLLLVTPRDAGKYTVKITQGSASASSDPMTITIKLPRWH